MLPFQFPLGVFPVLLIPDVHLPHAQNEVPCNFIPTKVSKIEWIALMA